MQDEAEPTWPARCGCGKSYTEERWKTLRLVGQSVDNGSGALELRVCVCGSTISVPVAPAK